jgi:hypothetical protein
LILSTPGDSPANGAKRYTYSTAGFLVKAETHNGADWQNQAEMKYDGLGNRLEMTGYAEGQSVTTRYALDNGQVLLAAAGEQTTAYLYGNGVIGDNNRGGLCLLPGGCIRKCAADGGLHRRGDAGQELRSVWEYAHQPGKWG